MAHHLILFGMHLTEATRQYPLAWLLLSVCKKLRSAELIFTIFYVREFDKSLLRFPLLGYSFVTITNTSHGLCTFLYASLGNSLNIYYSKNRVE
jgi:hypothetical protein